MKKIINISIFILLISVCATLCACSLFQKQPTQATAEKLKAPDFDINVYNHFAEWKRVKNADSYEIIVEADGETVLQIDTEWENCYVSFLTVHPGAILKARSICKDNPELNSDWSQIENVYPEEYDDEEFEKFKFLDSLLSAVWQFKEDIFIKYYLEQVCDVQDVHIDFSTNTLYAVITGRLQNNGFNTFSCAFTYESLDKESDIIGVLPVACSVSAYSHNTKYKVAESYVKSEAITGKLAEILLDESSELQFISDIPTNIDSNTKSFSAVFVIKYKQDGQYKYAITSQKFNLAYLVTSGESNYSTMIEKSDTCTIVEEYFYECGPLSSQFITDDVYFVD